MIGYFFSIIIFMISMMNVAFALPWLQQSHAISKKQSNFLNKETGSQQNFSGIWAGQCDNNPAIDMIIKHDRDKLSISYGFMEEKYVIGEVKSESKSYLNASENSNTTVRWSADYSALIFIHYNLFINSSGNLNVFFSKVFLVLDAGQLLVKGYHYQTGEEVGGFNPELISCTYHLK